MKKTLLILAIVYLWTFQTFSQSQWNPNNTVTASWSTTSGDVASNVKVKGGFVYVTGNSSEFNNGNPTYAIMTIKYDANLNEQWRAIYPSPIDPHYEVSVNGIDVDNNGNVFITGYVYNGANNDYLTIRYDINGNIVSGWPKTYNGTGNGNDRANAIGIDLNGNIYVTGASYTNHIVSLPNLDITTISYDQSGNIRSGWPKWFNAWGDKDDEAFALAIDNIREGTVRHHQGVYVAGWGDYGINCGGDCKKDAQLIYYNFNGGNEHDLHYGCGGCSTDPSYQLGDDFAKAVVVSPATGDVFCTGSKWCGETHCGPPNNCPWTDCEPGPGLPGSYEIFTFRSSWNGNVFELDHEYCDVARYDGPIDYGDDIGTSVVVDPTTGVNHHDFVYATGYSQQTNGPINYDYITIKYNHSEGNITDHGTKLWCSECNHFVNEDNPGCARAICTNQIYNSGGTEDDFAYSIAIDATGTNIFVTGKAGAWFNDPKIVTLQYRTSDGVPTCLGTYNGSGGLEDWGNAIAVDNSSPAHVYVAGTTNYYWQFANQSDFVILKYTACNIEQDTKPTNISTKKSSEIPVNYNLNQNYPNPFNPSTSISYAIPRTSYISLKIYNTLGQIVMNIQGKYQEAGYYTEDIDASLWASGIYFYELEAIDALNPANRFTDTKKMLLVK